MCRCVSLAYIIIFTMKKQSYSKGTQAKGWKRKAAENIVSSALKTDAVKQQVEKIIMSKAETKYITVGSQAVSLSVAGSTIALSSLAQGTDYNQRIGNHVYSKYVHFRIAIGFPAAPAATPENYVYRFSVVLDKQPNGALASYSTIWDLGTTDGAVSLRAASTYGDRFRILKEVEGALSNNGPQIAYHDCFVNLEMLDEKFRRAEYLTSAAGVAAWASNQILFACSVANLTGAAENNPPVITYNVRYAYKDA